MSKTSKKNSLNELLLNISNSVKNNNNVANDPNNESFKSNTSSTQQPFRLGKYMKASTELSKANTHKNQQIHSKSSKVNFSNNTTNKKLGSESNVLNMSDDKDLETNVEQEENMRIANESLNEILEKKFDSNGDEIDDNISYTSDDTVNLINEAQMYYLEDENELENRRTLFTEKRYQSNLTIEKLKSNPDLLDFNYSRQSTKFDENSDEEGDKPKDFTCEGVYLDQCKKQNIIPVSYFLRHINDQTLTLKHHGLGAPGIRPVSAALMNNSLVTKLDLSDNWLGPKGADHLAKMLKENCFISDLNLSENHLTTQGVEVLRDVLKQNNSLTHLTLQGNDFNDSTAAVWADIISNTVRIEYLDLSHNDFGEEAGRILGPAIAENASIKTMNLSWNNIRRKGAVAIAKGLSGNSGLKKFDISWNGFAQEGAKAFLKTLKDNETLEELNLSNNRIATEGAVYIAKGLMTNISLKIIRLGTNPMESPGCFSIIKSLQKNSNSKLELIDFSEIIVDKYFKEELKLFQTNFPNTKVITGSDGIQLKPKAKCHPVIKLRNFIEKRQLKLIDFFNKFDKDGSLSVSRDEFRVGIQELGINMSEDELDILIHDLDTDGDGEINYSEIAAGLIEYQTANKKSSKKIL